MRALTTAIVFVSVALAGGCKDDDKASVEKARFVVDTLAPIVEADVAQLRKGLPEGAKKLGENLPEDPAADLRALQDALKRSRDAVEDLRFAKGTFFAFANKDGVVLRSEDDPDRLANTNLFAGLPGLKKAVEAEGLVEQYGQVAEIKGVKTGDDVQWVLAHQVRAKDEVAGAFLSGWSFRAYALYLENQAKRALKEQAEAKGDNTPLFYVFIVKGDGAGGQKAYGTPTSPDVNAEAVEKQGVLEKTASGPFEATVEITNRKFGFAAKRVEALGSDAALAALSSVY